MIAAASRHRSLRGPRAKPRRPTRKVYARREASTTGTVVDAFESLRNDYDIARTGRFDRVRSGLSLGGSNADYHIRNESDHLKSGEYARDMDRNDSVVGQMTDRAAVNWVQEGYALDIDTGDKGVDAELKGRWHEFAEDPRQCDYAGEKCFADFEYLVPRQMLVDGDHFVLPLATGQLQSVEFHRCRTGRRSRSNIVNGVELENGSRRRLAYHFTPDEVSPFAPIGSISNLQRFPAFDDEGEPLVLHVYNPRRSSQTRGITAYAPMFKLATMLDDVQFAKLVQQQVVSCFAIFRKRKDIFPTTAIGAERQDQQSDGRLRTVADISPGMEVTGEPDEELQGFSPNVPNPEFFEQVKLILTLMGINLGMPLVMVLMDAGETNFSGWRGAINQARLGFRFNQVALKRKFHTPVYRWKVRQWLIESPMLAAAARRSDVRIFRHCWHPPTWPYVQPLDDAKADLTRLRNAQISPRRLHAENGADWGDMQSEIVADRAMAIRNAITEATAINTEFALTAGERVSWRDLMPLPGPEGMPAPQIQEVTSAAA